MASAKDFQAKAASAFQARQWQEATQQYNQAIALDPKDAASIANRSAAYLKNLNYDKALEDAKLCQFLEPSNSMGYLRHAAVFVAQQKYENAIVPLRQGLLACSTSDGGDASSTNTQVLEHALVGAQRAMVVSLPASRAARKMLAAHQAEQATTDVPTTRHIEKSKRLAKASLIQKAILLQEIEKLQDPTILWDIVFFFVLDSTGRGVASSEKVVQLVCQEKPDRKVALNKILPNDKDDLNSESFGKMMQQLATDTAQMTTPRDLVADLVEAILAAAYPEENMRMMSLFSIMDHDGNDTVSFFDLARDLYVWAHKNMDPSLLSNTKLLLMVEPNDSRRLDFAQFEKLVLSLASTWNECRPDVVDDLIVAFAEEPSLSDAVAAGAGDEILHEIIASGNDGGDAPPGKIDALTYARTKQLFDLFDVDGDGSIDFGELLTGLRRYQHASSEQAEQTMEGSFKGATNMQAEKIAIMIMGHDDDHNQTLDDVEFAEAMVDYSKAAETDLHQLIDFMCVMVQKQGDDGYEKAYSEATAAAAFTNESKSGKAFRHNSMLMTISDAEEDSSDEED